MSNAEKKREVLLNTLPKIISSNRVLFCSLVIVCHRPWNNSIEFLLLKVQKGTIKDL